MKRCGSSAAGGSFPDPFQLARLNPMLVSHRDLLPSLVQDIRGREGGLGAVNESRWRCAQIASGCVITGLVKLIDSVHRMGSGTDRNCKVVVIVINRSPVNPTGRQYVLYSICVVPMCDAES
jgi:hypothetical protein